MVGAKSGGEPPHSEDAGLGRLRYKGYPKQNRRQTKMAP